MNICGDVITDEMSQSHTKIVDGSAQESCEWLVKWQVANAKLLKIWRREWDFEPVMQRRCNNIQSAGWLTNRS